MDRLLRMKLLLVPVFLCHAMLSSSQLCYNLTHEHNVNELNLSSKTISCFTNQNLSVPTNYIKLDLSNNMLDLLPEYIISPSLTEVYLQKNNFKNLSDKFWNHKCLQELHLEGNELSSVQGSVICNTTILSIDCQCDIIKSVIKHHCQNSKCPGNFTCSLESKPNEAIMYFYEQTCKDLNLLPLYIVLSLLVVVALLVLAVRGIKGNSETTSTKQDAESTSPHQQPRYISSARPACAATNPSRESPYEPAPQHKDYENVLIGPLHSAQRPNYASTVQPTPRYIATMNEDFYLQCDVDVNDQPVYSNTDAVYYDYSAEAVPSPRDDDIYILPDQ